MCTNGSEHGVYLKKSFSSDRPEQGIILNSPLIFNMAVIYFPVSRVTERHAIKPLGALINRPESSIFLTLILAARAERKLPNTYEFMEQMS
jgi:hypothetical protein